VSAGWLAFGIEEAGETADGLQCEGLAARAQEARTALGLAVKELARQSMTSPAEIRAVESGTMPLLDTLEKIAVGLGVSPAWLAFGIGPMHLPKRGSKPLVAPAP
jgi:ribosome-binding protein aMBF1 (putative translation factor)